MKIKQILTIIIFFIILSLNSDDVIPENSDFSIDTLEKFQFIYPDNYSNYSYFLEQKLSNLFDFYSQSFQNRPENLAVILASNNDQFNNGFATPIPFNRFIIFNGGSANIDYFTSLSWAESLIYHEMAHSFQLSAQSNLSKNLSSIFGNTLFSPIILPFLFPNVTLPDLILEGNAVFNESIFGVGGRLYSGQYKAKFFAILPLLDKSRLINNHLEFPYLEEKYIVGGFFFKYLADKFGIDRVNQFFIFHAKEHDINPFRLNRSFKDYFQQDFDNLIHEFLEFYTKKSEKFILQKGAIITSSKKFYPISKSKNGIFLTYVNEFQLPQLIEFTKNREINNLNEIDGERLFEVNGEILIFKNGYVSNNKVKYGLWDTENSVKKGTLSKIYFDYFNGEWLYFDLNKSFQKAKLYKNGKFIDEVDSSPIFDNMGNIYYFKNNGISRKLYKNKKPIFEIQGYYSQIIGATDKNIYFIASTKLGSSIFKFNLKSKQILRVLKGDNIIDGKLLNNNQAVITTVTADRYNYNLVNLNSGWIEKPFFEQIQQKKLIHKYSKILDSYSYNELSNLHLTKFNFSYSNNAKTLFFLFNDPIGWNNFSILYENNNNNILSLGYENYRYFDFNLNVDTDNNLFLSAVFPISTTGYKSKSFGIESIFDKEDENGITIFYNNIYQKNNPYSMFINSENSYQIAYRNEKKSGIVSGLYKWVENFDNGLIFNFGLQGAKDRKNNQGILITDSIYDKSLDKTALFLQGLQFSDSLNEFYSAKIGFSKEFKLSLYLYALPLAIRREGLNLEFTTVNYKKSKFKELHESAITTTFDLLVGHKLSIPLALSFRKNSISGDSIHFDIKGEF